MNLKAISILAGMCIALMSTVAAADIAVPRPQPKPKATPKIKVVFTQTKEAVLIVPKKLRGQLSAVGNRKRGNAGAAPPTGNAPAKPLRFSAPFNTVIAGAAFSLAAILCGLTLLRRKLTRNTQVAVGVVASLVIFAFVACCATQLNANAPPPTPQPDLPVNIEFGTFDLKVKEVEAGDVIELQLPMQLRRLDQLNLRSTF